MLCKFAYIDKEGGLEIRGNPKAIYQTMVEVSMSFVALAGLFLRRALLIGLRYAVCRRQF